MCASWGIYMAWVPNLSPLKSSQEKYERDEMTPSIDAAKKLANILDTTVGYLLRETEQADLFKDKKMLQRLQDIIKLPEKERRSNLLTLDHFIKAAKISLL